MKKKPMDHSGNLSLLKRKSKKNQKPHLKKKMSRCKLMRIRGKKKMRILRR
jgi:hypothetical protein